MWHITLEVLTGVTVVMPCWLALTVSPVHLLATRPESVAPNTLMQKVQLDCRMFNEQRCGILVFTVRRQTEFCTDSLHSFPHLNDTEKSKEWRRGAQAFHLPPSRSQWKNRAELKRSDSLLLLYIMSFCSACHLEILSDSQFVFFWLRPSSPLT